MDNIMYKVKFIATGKIHKLEGFVNNKIIVRFNNDLSVGTVPKTGYEPVGFSSWEELEKNFNKLKVKGLLDGDGDYLKSDEKDWELSEETLKKLKEKGMA